MSLAWSLYANLVLSLLVTRSDVETIAKTMSFPAKIGGEARRGKKLTALSHVPSLVK